MAISMHFCEVFIAAFQHLLIIVHGVIDIPPKKRMSGEEWLNDREHNQR
jgi:hypothetical protein